MKRFVALDTETTGLNAWKRDQPFSLAMHWDDGDQMYWEWPVDPMTREVSYDLRDLAEIQKYLDMPGVDLVFHNAKFDVRMMQRQMMLRIGRRHALQDTMFAAHCCNSDEMTLALKPLCKKYLEIDDQDQKDLKKAVVAARRFGKKHGWKISQESHVRPSGEVKVQGCVEADYWLPRAVQNATGMESGGDLAEVYCLLDVERTAQLWRMYCYAMEEEEVRHCYEFEMELWWTTFEMETRGVRVNLQTVKKETRKQERLWRSNMRLLRRQTGREDFNPDAAAHVKQLVYETLGIVPTRFTPKGSPSVDATALTQIGDNETVNRVLQCRAAEKAFQFFAKYRAYSCDEMGLAILHADFQQVGPRTGRFSCRNPNLQNVPDAVVTRSPVPIQARRPFGPRPGYRWYHIDYDQLEVCIFAEVAQEQFMLGAILGDRDIHTECTNKAWGGQDNEAATWAALEALELHREVEVKNEKVNRLWTDWKVHRFDDRDWASREDLARDWLNEFDWDIVAAEGSIGKKNSRSKAKMILFAKVFGGGPNAIKDLLRCSKTEAVRFLEEYDEAFPRIEEYTDELTAEARRDGCIWNAFGHRLTVDPRFAYRCVNYMVQGTAAILMKKAMFKCDAYLRASKLDAHMVMTIHDEIVFEVRDEHAQRGLIRDLCRIMLDTEGCIEIPLSVEVLKVTESWNKKEKLTWKV